MAEITVTAENFKNIVLENQLPVLVDFWAPWCGPCRMVGPVITEIAGELEGKAAVGKVNVDEQQSLAAEYGVMSIPTLLVFKNGEVTGTAVGVRSKADILKMLGCE